YLSLLSPRQPPFPSTPRFRSRTRNSERGTRNTPPSVRSAFALPRSALQTPPPRSPAAPRVSTPFARRCPASGRAGPPPAERGTRSEEHTSELQSLRHLVCRLL